MQNGLLSNFVNDAVFVRPNLYVATDEGLSVINRADATPGTVYMQNHGY